VSNGWIGTISETKRMNWDIICREKDYGTPGEKAEYAIKE
jgi:hypothetical protein